MIKVSVSKNSLQTHEAKFETEALARAWVDQVAATGAFGKNDRWLNIDGVTEENLDTADAINTETRFENGVDVTYYFFLKEYDVIYQDISAAIALEKEKEESREALALVEFLKIHIRTLNKAKLKSGVWNAQTFQAWLQSPIIQAARTTLNDASLKTYKSYVLQSSAFYTEDEIAYIVSKIDAHENKWATILGG